MYLFIVSMLAGLSLITHAEPPTPRFSDLSWRIQQFKRNPKKFMSEDIERQGPTNPKAISPRSEIAELKFENRCQCWPEVKSFLLNPERPLAAWDGHNRPESLLGEGDWLRSLEQMESAQVLKYYLPESPWAADYFPIARGGLAARAFDAEFLKLKDWKSRYDYIEKHPLKEIYEKKTADEVDRLSVAEKYDLLSGQVHGSLSHSMWREGKSYFDRDGKVEDWMGICHGWAPASIMVPRPKKKLNLVNPDNVPITLYPAEIKGLISLQWANNPYRVRFIGQRCNSNSPKKDEVGRVIEEGCFDVNPATWHLVTANRLGVAKKSFVFDATYDYEVWNQPIYGYQYTYFNPKTGEEKTNLAEAKVELKDFEDDTFKKHRDPRAVWVIGIAMVVGYTIEYGVNRFPEDNPDFDTLTWARYLYDLELDADGKIIGGEWYTYQHPDFLWAPEDGETADSPGDAYMQAAQWQKAKPLPNSWRAVIAQLSPYSVIPRTLNEHLLSWSTSNEP